MCARGGRKGGGGGGPGLGRAYLIIWGPIDNLTVLSVHVLAYLYKHGVYFVIMRSITIQIKSFIMA